MIRYERIYVHTLTLYKEIQANTFTFIENNVSYLLTSYYIHIYIHNTNIILTNNTL
jgi:hypothetical protein